LRAICSATGITRVSVVGSATPPVTSVFWQLAAE
jgi:hypothetical protein